MQSSPSADPFATSNPFASSSSSLLTFPTSTAPSFNPFVSSCSPPYSFFPTSAAAHTSPGRWDSLLLTSQQHTTQGPFSFPTSTDSSAPCLVPFPSTVQAVSPLLATIDSDPFGLNWMDPQPLSTSMATILKELQPRSTRAARPFIRSTLTRRRFKLTFPTGLAGPLFHGIRTLQRKRTDEQKKLMDRVLPRRKKHVHFA